MTPLFLTPAERHALRRVLRMLEVDRFAFALSVLLGCLGLGSAIALAATSAWLIARASQMPPVLTLSVAATAVRMFGIGRALMRYLQRIASHHVAMHGMDSLRQNIYAGLAAARFDRIAHLKRGDLLARAGADVDDVGDFVIKTVLPVCVSTIVGIGTVVGICLISPAAGMILAACLLVSGVATPLLTMRSTRLAEEASRAARTNLAATSMTLMEGASELQVDDRLGTALDELSRTEDALTSAIARTARIQGLAAGIDRLAMGMAVVGALLVAIPQTNGGLVPAVLLAVLTLTPLAAFEGTAELAPAAAQLVRSAQAAVRIAELVPEEPETGSTRGVEIPAASTHPVLEARGLAIGWPGGPTLAEGIDLELRPGRHIALVGPSGIGKTTLLMTLAGMIPPHAGSVTVGGVDVCEADVHSLADCLTITAEDAHVFATTVIENLRVARAGIDEAEATALLGAVGLGPWLAALPQGLDTLLGSGGTTVSGGERRRLLMARALAAPAPLLLLDEAGEHLDAARADSLMETLLEPGAGRGVLVVTHRLSALSHADEVLILDRGPALADPGVTEAQDAPARITARGTHEQILARRADYRWALEQESR